MLAQHARIRGLVMELSDEATSGNVRPETLRNIGEELEQHIRLEEREVFLLRMNGDLTYEEIAEQRETPVGTVKTQMRAALQKLKKVLNPQPTLSDE